MDPDRIQRGPFKGWDEGSVAMLLVVVAIATVAWAVKWCAG